MQLLTLAGSIFFFIYSVAAFGVDNVGPCTKARQDAGQSMPGKFLPQCTDNGYFQAVQCHGSTGRCWCVVPDTGKEIEGSSVLHSEPKCTICYVKRADALRPRTVGNFVPQCDDDGLFNPTQYYPSTGQSWCVNRYTGEEYNGTRSEPHQPSNMNCTILSFWAGLGMYHAMEDQGPCYAKTVEERGSRQTPGFYTPGCTANGYYRTQQSHSSTGYSWCVNPATGTEIPNTRRGPAEPKSECGKCFQEIEEKLSRKPVIGKQLPQCNPENGDYLPEQRQEGYRWCANPKTGAVEGKKYPPGDKSPLPCVNPVH